MGRLARASDGALLHNHHGDAEKHKALEKTTMSVTRDRRVGPAAALVTVWVGVQMSPGVVGRERAW